MGLFQTLSDKAGSDLKKAGSIDLILGMRPALSSVQEAVALFLQWCRPRGRKLPESQGLETSEIEV